MLTNKDLEKLTKFFYTKEEIDKKHEGTDAKLVKIDGKFDVIDEKFEKIDEKFEKIDERFEKIDERFDEIDEKFDETNRHFDVVAEEIKNSIRIVAEQVSANTEKLADHDQKIETLITDVSFLKSRIIPVKAKIKK